MKLTNEQYNLIKRLLTVGVPAVIALITSLGGLYGFQTDVIVGTISAVATFFGVMLTVISNKYDKEKESE